MKSLLGKPVFSVAGAAYCWEDIVLAARVWKEWAAFSADIRLKAACVKRVRATREYPRRSEVEAAAKEFRETRDLYDAAAMNAWLARFDLSAEDWMRYIRRTLLAHKWSGQRSALLEQYPVHAREIARILKVEGICSGTLARFAWKLAARAAVFHHDNKVSPAENFQTKRQALARIDAVYRAFRRHTLTPEAVRGRIAAHAADWIRVECDRASFADESAAKEAALCIREDGATLDETAARARTTVQPASVFLDQLELPLRSVFLSARKGDLLGPLNWAGELRLVLVRAKVLPSAADPVLQRRAEDLILQQAVERALADRVHWHAPWPDGKMGSLQYF